MPSSLKVVKRTRMVNVKKMGFELKKIPFFPNATPLQPQKLFPTVILNAYYGGIISTKDPNFEIIPLCGTN